MKFSITALSDLFSRFCCRGVKRLHGDAVCYTHIKPIELL